MPEFQSPFPDTDKLPYYEGVGVSIVKDLSAASEHVLKGIGTKLLVEAGARIELPLEMKGLLVAGGVGCLTAGEVAKIWQSGELAKLKETADTMGGKAAIKEYFSNRFSSVWNASFFITDVLADSALIGAATGIVDPNWAGLSIAKDFTSFRSDYHIFAAKAHGVFAGLHAAVGTLGGFGETLYRATNGAIKGLQKIGSKRDE